jgi:hypothetical protein
VSLGGFCYQQQKLMGVWTLFHRKSEWALTFVLALPRAVNKLPVRGVLLDHEIQGYEPRKSGMIFCWDFEINDSKFTTQNTQSDMKIIKIWIFQSKYSIDYQHLMISDDNESLNPGLSSQSKWKLTHTKHNQF